MEGNGHWTDDKTEGPFSTPEAKTLVAKYDTEDDAIVGGLEAQKKFGKQFVLPDSMDKLADDDMRTEFRTGALRVLGSVDSVDALKDFNFTVGRPEGYELTESDTAVATAFSQFIVDNDIPVGMAGKMVEFYNILMEKAKQDIENKYLENSETTNKKMVEILKGEENVTKQAELIKRMFKDEAGLTTEEFESIAEALVEHKYTHSAVLQKALGNFATKLVAEGTTESGAGAGAATTEHKQTPYEYKKSRWPNSEDMWGKPDDKWEDQSVQVRKQAGFGKKEEKK